MQDPIRAAAEAGLHYVGDDEPGFERARWGGGFTYRTPDGETVRDRELRRRFEALVIPPAWTEVWIALRQDAHILATGRDSKGRKQYIYHPDWQHYRSMERFRTLPAFGRVLPDLRERCDHDMRRPRLCEERVLAICVTLLDVALLRMGSPEYARDNETYGLTTLEPEHVTVVGSRILLEFDSKGGQALCLGLRHRRLARQIARCENLAGDRLFSWECSEGLVHHVDPADLNDYLRDATGADFTGKTFRTWGATVAAADELLRRPLTGGEKDLVVAEREAIKAAAGVLHNTPAVCKAHYVAPRLFDVYREGDLHRLGERLKEPSDDPYALTPHEALVVEALDEG